MDSPYIKHFYSSEEEKRVFGHFTNFINNIRAENNSGLIKIIHSKVSSLIFFHEFSIAFFIFFNLITFLHNFHGQNEFK